MAETEADLNKLRVVDLRQRLTELGLAVGGKYLINIMYCVGIFVTIKAGARGKCENILLNFSSTRHQDYTTYTGYTI